MAFHREHPVALGLLIGLVGAPILIFAAIRYPSVGTFIFGYPAWSRFAVFNATIFPFAIAYFSPRHGSRIFWIVMTGIFVLHMIFFVAFMHYVRQLTGFDYIIYGPIEALVFAIVIPRAMRMFHGRRLASGPDPK
jgi:hypothetical protein